MSVLLFLLFSVTSSAFLLPRVSRYGVITNYDGPSSEAFFESKRYDRNCFFSPVQCMLTYNDETRLPLVVTRKASGRKRFEPIDFSTNISQ